MKSEEQTKAAKCIKDSVSLKFHYDAALNNWPVQMEKLYIPALLGKTFCIKSGDEKHPPMVLIHGALSNSATWMADIRRLNEQYQTYCLDVPGDPGGSEDRRFSWDGQYFSNWIKQCMDFLKIERAVLGGLSLGGWASLRFAIDYPERAGKLFLLAPAGLGPIKTWSASKLLFLSLMGKWGQEKILRMLFNGREITQEMRDFFEATSRNCKPRFGNPPMFSNDELSSLRMPVVYIGAKDDALIDTEKSVERLSKNVRDARILVLDEGHALIGLDDKVFELLG